MKYTKAYFIARFEAIPEEKWCVGSYRDCVGRCCALGHCGPSPVGTMGTALSKLLGGAICINDGEHPRYQQPTPKQRILAALRDLP